MNWNIAQEHTAESALWLQRDNGYQRA
jgi:hypothetical protein